VNTNWKLFCGELKTENLNLNKFFENILSIVFNWSNHPAVQLKMKACCGVIQKQIEKYENFVVSKTIIFSGMCILLNMFCGAQFGYNNVFKLFSHTFQGFNR
jgi:hypothetical protein